MTINKNMTIAGQNKGNVIINAEQLSRLFYINPGVTVNFINITFLNGNETKAYDTPIASNGGAIYSRGNLIIKDCNFTSNSANSGGAIYSNSGPTIEIYNSIFSYNTLTPSKRTYEDFSPALNKTTNLTDTSGGNGGALCIEGTTNITIQIPNF